MTSLQELISRFPVCFAKISRVNNLGITYILVKFNIDHSLLEYNDSVDVDVPFDNLFDGILRVVNNDIHKAFS
jgi:hypothetical protein